MKTLYYKIIKTEKLIEGNTYCDVLKEYQKITKDNRTFEELCEEFPENVALITKTNQVFKNEAEFNCFMIISLLETLKIITKI